MYTLAKIILYFSNVSAVPAIVIGWHRRGLLWWYVLLDFSVDISSFFLKRCNLPREWLSNVFLPTEFMLVGSYLITSIFQERWHKWGKIILGVFALTYFIHSCLTSPLEGNYIEGALLYLLLIILCLFALVRVMQQAEHVKIEQSPLFILSSAFLLFASGVTTILIFKKHLSAEHASFVTDMWKIVLVLNIIKNLSIAWVFILANRRSRAE